MHKPLVVLTLCSTLVIHSAESNTDKELLMRYQSYASEFYNEQLLNDIKTQDARALQFINTPLFELSKSCIYIRNQQSAATYTLSLDEEQSIFFMPPFFEAVISENEAVMAALYELYEKAERKIRQETGRHTRERYCTHTKWMHFTPLLWAITHNKQKSIQFICSKDFYQDALNEAITTLEKKPDLLPFRDCPLPAFHNYYRKTIEELLLQARISFNEKTLVPAVRKIFSINSLRQAIELDDADAIRNLQALGQSMNSFSEEESLAPLYFAAQKAKVNAIKALVMAGANIHEENAAGENALCAAARSDSALSVEMLLKLDADKPFWKATEALKIAVKERKTFAIEAFMKANTDPFHEISGESPWTIARDHLTHAIWKAKAISQSPDSFSTDEIKSNQATGKAFCPIVFLFAEVGLMNAIKEKDIKKITQFSEQSVLHPSCPLVIGLEFSPILSLQSLTKALTTLRTLPEDEQTKTMKLPILRTLATLSDEPTRFTEEDHCNFLTKGKHA